MLQRTKNIFLFPFMLLVVLLAACGSNSTTTTGASATTSTPATNCPATATGTISSISSNTLSITNRQGVQVLAAFSNTTVFIQQSTGTTADLQEGTSVTATLQKNADSTYSALLITIRPTGTSLTGSSGILRSCGLRRGGAGVGGSGFPSAAATPGVTRQSLSGTVGQLNGTALTITDTTGSDYTVQLTSTTRISKTVTATASDLKNGETVTLLGTKDSQGVIHATYIQISTRVLTPTASNG